MKYAYEDLGPDQFEQLIVFLCQELLGIATQGFARGPDGGRDAKFIGTANLYPSKTGPWCGTTIIQAKHTNGYNKLFSESDFFNENSDSSIINKEIKKIKNLRSSKELDHYMLFANRRLAANTENKIRSFISRECNIVEPSIALCGIEQLESWLKTFPDVASRANLDMVDSPLIVSSNDLSEVIHALAGHQELGLEIQDIPPTLRIPYAEKNEINNMSAEYASALRNKYLKDTTQIQSFLSAPENFDLMRLYENVIDEFQFKIIARRKEYQSFDNIINYLMDLLISRDQILKKHQKLTRAMLFYMYWNCDIGSEGYASPN